MNTSTGRTGWEHVDVPARGTRFIALFADGSGARVFYRKPLGELVDSQGDAYPGGILDDQEFKQWMSNVGFVCWTALPDGMKLFFEEARK